jgi:hypothetical protein
MRTSDEITVSMIHIPTWENELKVVEITQPIRIEEWLHKSAHPGNRVEVPSYDSQIAGGRYDGGQVITVHDNDEENTYMFALPPEAVPLLLGLLPEDQYRRLVVGASARAAMNAS